MKHNSLIRHPGFSSEYRNWTVWLLAVFIAFSMCGAAQAQPTKKNVRIGFLAQVSSSAISARIDAFRQGLRDLGYVEGHNLKIECRDACVDGEELVQGARWRWGCASPGRAGKGARAYECGRHRDGRSNCNARSQGSHRHDSHCDGVR